MIGEERDEQKEFESGPLSVLMDSVKKTTQVYYIIIIIYLAIYINNNNLSRF